MRVVMDTNCLLVVVPKKSPFRWIYDALLEGKIEWVVTTEILAEYEELLARFYSDDYADLILKVLINLPNVVKINPISFNWLLIDRDPDDNKFVDAYVASNSDAIITNDHHFQILKSIPFPIVNCIKLADFKI